MRYPRTRMLPCHNAVEQHGIVLSELCDTVMPDKWFNVTETARRLDCLRQYQGPERYLRAVLKAILADYAERPDAYEYQPPIKLRGKRMDVASV